MSEPGRQASRALRAIRWVALFLAAGTASSGCVGPRAIRYTRLRYNEVVRDTSDEQLLINIVRLRYADSPVFIDLPNITSQFEMAGGGSYAGPNQSVSSNFGYAGLSGRDTPTLSYHPREGREIAKALLTPISADLFSIVNAGADIEQILLMTINDINDVPNAPRATTLVPKVPDSNREFLRGVRLLQSVREREGLELAVSIREQPDVASDPIAQDKVLGRDILNAARDGYVYRTRADGMATVVKREKELIIQIRPRFVHSPEMQEVSRLFHLTPGLSAYKIKSELSGEATALLPNPLGNDTIYLNMRSVLQIMTFLSKGVTLPAEHIEQGIAPITITPDGRIFDWQPVTAGSFCVQVQKHRPHSAEVAVPYRGYWFYIPTNDVHSRAVLAILEVLVALQESDRTSTGPLLTLPLGG